MIKIFKSNRAILTKYILLEALCDIIIAWPTFLAIAIIDDMMNRFSAPPEHDFQDILNGLFLSLLFVSVAYFVRLALQLWWMFIWRYKATRRHGFQFRQMIKRIVISFAVAYVIAIALAHPFFWDRFILESYGLPVLPSFLGAILAPCLIYWRTGTCFDREAAMHYENSSESRKFEINKYAVV